MILSKFSEAIINTNIKQILYSQITILLALQASDVLAVELLQKDARLAVSGEMGRPCSGGT